MNEYRPQQIGAEFLHDLYRRYVANPASVDSSWGAFFDGLGEAGLSQLSGRGGEGGIDPHRTALMLGRLIEGYRWRGHLHAKLDPLGLATSERDPDLALDRLGLSFGDASVAPALNGELGLPKATLQAVLSRLEEIYCGTTGFEFMHLPDATAREWFRGAVETGWGMPDARLRRIAAERLIEADELEQFMQRRYTGKKRFGVEGAESLLSWFWAVVDRSAALGVRSVMMGGTSRGRLNQVVNFLGKPLHAMFAEFYGAPPFPDGVGASGDVAYHLGYVGEQRFGDVSVRLEYCNNPSHLEAVDPVTLGRVRAMQARYDDPMRARTEVMGLLVHTDAAFAGQGLIAEILQLSGLDSYTVGGTIHVIINNQLGFTTAPERGRSSTYCTDVAKTIGAPVLHVNADDVDATLRAAILAAEYRHRFGRDVVVDLVCYRRRGHNEVDEPGFTQPVMYQKIATHPSSRQLYLDRLCKEGVLQSEDEQAVAAAYQARLETAYETSKSYRANSIPAMAAGDRREAGLSDLTGLPIERLREIGIALSTVPAGIEPNPKLERVFGERVEALTAGAGIGWPLAEALAIGSLVKEGVPVRFSGQDTPRGAFSQRHFALYDRQDGREVSIFESLSSPRARYEIICSPLAEYATLGFEYGYSLDAPDCLVVWEAQFGDFANVAQVIIDQFVSSGEDKWLQPSHLALLLPHGLEGQGPEHSSARIERYLQMCARDNMMVANCTTPANYFHILRRQARGPRRPLILFTPKSLLRHRAVVSNLAEMELGTQFQPVLGQDRDAPLRRLVLCSGKIYWDLAAERERRGIKDVGLVRLEQLYPFPASALKETLSPHRGAEIVWCQEEPRNMGPWSFVDRRIEAVLRQLGSPASWPAYVGRPDNPSPAIGTTNEHNADQARLVQHALEGKVEVTSPF